MFENLSSRLEGVVRRIREGSADRGRRRRDPRRDPHSAARSGCQRRRHPRGHQPVARRGHRRHPITGPRPDPAGRQARQRRADPHPRRRDAAHHIRQPAAHRGADGRPAGFRQDDGGRQAGPLVQDPGPPATARRCRPSAPCRRRAAAHARPADRRPGVLRAGRSRAHGRQGPRRGPPARPQRAHRRHRRPARHRRRDDAAGSAHLRRRRSPVHVPRDRCDDRSGRRRCRRGLQRDPRDRRGDPLQARRRCPWRCRAVGQGGDRETDRVRLTGEKLDAFEQFHPDRMAGRSSAWATC